MKKLLLAFVLLAALSVPVFADGNIRIAGSLDLGNSWNSGLGISAHAIYAPFIIDNILRVGAGATFQLPLGDVSQFAVYASGFWYPIPTFVQDKKTAWYDRWYVKFNLGFNFPLIADSSYASPGGGLYWGWGTGYEITDTFFAEILRGVYAWSHGGASYGYSILHLTFGAKF
ncbi:MAG: hypothetical protein LBC99_00405 [Spirochaetota bacterium]|nr:hypothetical protein [Spirochaetota bacterium]